MRSGIRVAFLGLLLLSLCAGCARRRRTVRPSPQAQAPSLPSPAQTAEMIPPLPSLPAYTSRTAILNTAVPPETNESAWRRRRALRRRARPEAAENRQPEHVKPAANPQAASGAPSDISPIGQLSAASGDGNPADGQAIARLIASTERGLAAIKRPLSSQEQKTAAQIRTFLAHARDSLKADDLDGARTLAVKAHLLLRELQKQ